MLLKCHSSLTHNVFIFVELPSLPSTHVELYLRVFWTIPWFREINVHLITPIAFVSVHCHRPSTRKANPSNGDGLNPVTTENWHPMWGLWLVAETQSSTASSRLATQWPTAKSYKNQFISAKEQQQTYDFGRVADRLTQTVCTAITSAQRTTRC